VKSELAVVLLAEGSLKMSLARVVRTISRNESTAAFQRWMDCCEKYICLGINSAEKYPETTEF
jgi:hypothetical protein